MCVCVRVFALKVGQQKAGGWVCSSQSGRSFQVSNSCRRREVRHNGRCEKHANSQSNDKSRWQRWRRPRQLGLRRASHFSKQRTTDRGALCARLIEFIQPSAAVLLAARPGCCCCGARRDSLMTQPQFFNDFSDRTLLPECLFN